jgi:hypothetical protein
MALSWVIKDFMDMAARECSITPPSNWISATDTNSILLKTYLKDVVRELLERGYWNQLNRDSVVTGDGTADYDLPTDFLRLADDPHAIYENSPNRGACIPVVTNTMWTALLEDGASGADRYYRLQGSEIEFFATPPVGAEITISYMSKNWKTAADGGTPGNTWDNVTDLSLLPGELLQVGTVWRFKRHKRLYYADFKAEFEGMLARAISNDRPAGKISTDRTNRRRGPWDIPVPDYIPPS